MVEEVCLVQSRARFELGVDNPAANCCASMAVFARSFLLIAMIILLLGNGHLGAADASSARGIHGQALTLKEQMKGVVLSRRPIYYPLDARWAGTTGSGIFEMRIDPKTRQGQSDPGRAEHTQPDPGLGSRPRVEPMAFQARSRHRSSVPRGIS